VVAQGIYAFKAKINSQKTARAIAARGDSIKDQTALVLTPD
jgi:hypothetical protein